MSAAAHDAYLAAPRGRFLGQARRRAAPPKLVTLNNALLSAMHAQGPPDPTRESARFGLWVENACLAFAVNQGQRVTYWREEPLEIDAVVEGSWGDWAIEVKTSSFNSLRLQDRLESGRRNPKFRPVVITASGDEPLARRRGVAAISWKEFLISAPHAREKSMADMQGLRAVRVLKPCRRRMTGVCFDWKRQRRSGLRQQGLRNLFPPFGHRF